MESSDKGKYMAIGLLAKPSTKTWGVLHPLAKKLTLALFFASLTGLCAQISLRLPFSEVPVTLQTFAVFLSVLVLGRSWGSLSQALYVLLGLAGIPWFANVQGGFLYLSGPTGGYLIGFVTAAILIGLMQDHYPKTKSFFPTTLLLIVCNFLIIYPLGLAQLWLWFSVNKDTSLSFAQLLTKGALPFVVGDIYKIISVAALAQVQSTKHPVASS